MATLELEDIGKSFGPVQAVDRVSLRLDEGSLTGLLGPSGCGKSTLLRLIAGLEIPTAGRVRISGEDVTAAPPEDRHVGIMFQSYALFPHMSVGDNLAFPLRMRGIGSRNERTRRVEAALELVRMSGMAGRNVRQLSGGQQQRVALARAFIAEPRVLLLDEPLSNLDARLREEMQVELIELHRKLALTTVFVTHDQEEALSLADRVVLMRAGRIEQEGPPEAMYARPSTAFAADFIGAANLLSVEVIHEEGGWRAHLGQGLSVSVTAPPEAAVGPLHLMLRQEAVAVLTAPPAGVASLPATVRARVFRGANLRYVLDLGGQTLIALVPVRGGGPVPGDEVHAAWSPEEAVLLAERGEPPP
jgi:putative spermidine/putrescine transport system ATP-binding protein